MTSNSLLESMLHEYDVARGYSESLVNGLTDEQCAWRPNEHSSGLGWHLGHQAAVNHYMVRNLTAAEPSFNQAFDALFDSATTEPQRGDLPPMEHVLAFRSEVATSTKSVIDRIASGDVGAPTQLRTIAEGLLRAVINHEYQHNTWVLEVRNDIGETLEPGKPSDNVIDIEGYWVLAI
jgi:hypothetical protein